MENKNTDLILNHDNTATWTFKEEGEILGTYAGTFVFKCFLNPLEILSAGRLQRELLGDAPQPRDDEPQQLKTERFLAFTLAQLQKRIVKAPPFWGSALEMAGNLPDIDFLSMVLVKALDAETLYKAKLAEKRSQAQEAAKNSVAAHQERLNIDSKP